MYNFNFIFIDIRSDGPFQNKLNVNAPEFKFKLQCEPSINFPQFIHHSKSSGNIQQQIQLAAAARRHAIQVAKRHEPITFSHPFELLNAKVSNPSSDRVQSNVRNEIIIEFKIYFLWMNFSQYC